MNVLDRFDASFCPVCKGPLVSSVTLTDYCPKHPYQTGFRKPRLLTPRIIRTVIKRDAKGRAKVARDRKLLITMERVTARYARPCGYKSCPHVLFTGRGWIKSGTEYAKVTRIDDVKRVGHRSLPNPRDYHFDCIPEDARPLVRFLKP